MQRAYGLRMREKGGNAEVKEEKRHTGVV